MTDKQANNEKTNTRRRFGGVGGIMNDKEKKSLLTYLAVGIFIVEFFITVVAVVYGVSTMRMAPQGGVSFDFPMKEYLIALFVAPVAVLLLAQLVNIGFSQILLADQDLPEDAEAALSERSRKWFALFKGLPAVILLGGLLALGAVVLNLDIIMSSVLELGKTVAEVAIWLSGGLIAAWLVSYVVRLWFMHKARRLQSEYAYRQEVLERTGVAILDNKTVVTSDGRMLSLDGKRATTQQVIDATPVLKPVETPGELDEGGANSPAPPRDAKDRDD